MKNHSLAIVVAFILSACGGIKKTPPTALNNPINPGWYADPEGAVFGKRYWIFPTTSGKYEDQIYFNAFSSRDLVTWKKHERVLDNTSIKWAKQAMWAPSVVEKGGKYYFFFSANDVQRPGGPMWNEGNGLNRSGGIGIAIADKPGGPYKDYLGKPLIDGFHNDAQPIDQFVYQDTDGTWYMFYGGWSRCNLVKLNSDFTGLIPWEDGSYYKEITPKGYVEGPFMFKRNGTYYFM